MAAKAQSVRVDSSQTSGTSCYGPQAAVGSGKDAVVSLDCAAPKVEWSWKTNNSEVSPVPGPNQIEWKTVFTGASGSGPTFWWCPGLLVKNVRAQSLELGVRNEITWVDAAGKTTTHVLAWPKPLVTVP